MFTFICGDPALIYLLRMRDSIHMHQWCSYHDGNEFHMDDICVPHACVMCTSYIGHDKTDMCCYY